MTENLPAGVHRLSAESQAALARARPGATPSWRATRNRSGWPPQPSRRWIRSVKPEWRWSGLLTRAQVVRNHPDPPIKDQCPQRPRERILNPSTQVTVGSSPTRSSNLLRSRRNTARQSTHDVRARGETGRRAVLRGRWETMPVRSRPSAPIAHVPIWRRDRTVDPGRRVRSSSWAPISGCSLARPKRTPRARETAGSSPAILTNFGRLAQR